MFNIVLVFAWPSRFETVTTSVPMWIRMLAAMIEWHYRRHKINVSLRLHSFLRDCQRFFFKSSHCQVQRTGMRLDGRDGHRRLGKDGPCHVGAPGSGKSVGLLCLILSLVCTHPVSEVNLIIFDIGSDTLDVLEGLPHGVQGRPSSNFYCYPKPWRG